MKRETDATVGRLTKTAIDIFETFLSLKHISIPNCEKTGDPEEAKIFGSDRKWMEDILGGNINRILMESGGFKPGEKTMKHNVFDESTDEAETENTVTTTELTVDTDGTSGNLHTCSILVEGGGTATFNFYEAVQWGVE